MTLVTRLLSIYSETELMASNLFNNLIEFYNTDIKYLL